MAGVKRSDLKKAPGNRYTGEKFAEDELVLIIQFDNCIEEKIMEIRKYRIVDTEEMLRRERIMLSKMEKKYQLVYRLQ
eukprot:GAHX01002584.1.p1 GENE.GAHX01002584.1~~GAHX01002584.1.p1  ORF type:complete len:78 (-),score=13.35 GAHX01002584.1:112-345(-)